MVWRVLRLLNKQSLNRGENMSYLQDALRGRLLTAHEVEAVKVVKHVNALMVLTKKTAKSTI